MAAAVEGVEVVAAALEARAVRAAALAALRFSLDLQRAPSPRVAHAGILAIGRTSLGRARVAELVDALDLGSSIARCGGSSPSARTIAGAQQVLRRQAIARGI